MEFYDISKLPGDFTGEIPVAADAVIDTGGMVAVDASGDAQNADDAVTGFVAGCADQGVDNTGGSAGDLKVKCKRGVFALQLADTNPPTKAHIGSIIFADTPDSVTHTGTCRAGLLLGFHEDGRAIVDTTKAALATA